MLWVLRPMISGNRRMPLPPANEAAAGKREVAPQARKRGRPPTGVKTPWKELGLSKATYYRRIRAL
jgi:hypothetical protein